MAHPLRLFALVTFAVLWPARASAEEHGLFATFYDNIDFTGASVTRVDPVIDLSWGDGAAPVTGLSPYSWSAIWTGAIVVPASGTYTFTTLSDDGIELIVDGEDVIGDWTGHRPTADTGSVALSAGPHPLQLRFYNGHGSARLRLSWAGPGFADELVPSSALLPLIPPAHIGSGSGLSGSYFLDPMFMGAPATRRVDAIVDFTPSSGWPAPIAGRPAFSVLWRGWLEPTYTDDYQLSVETTGGVALTLDGCALIDRLDASSPEPAVAHAHLAAGHRYELVVRLRQVGDGAAVHLRWSSALTSLQVIPSTQLYPYDAGDAVRLAAPALIESRTNPAWVEGSVGSGEAVVAATSDGAPAAVARSTRTRWHLRSADTANEGLRVHPGHNIVSLTSDLAGAADAATVDVEWIATDLSRLPYGLDRVRLRAGDELLATATGTGDVLSLIVDDGREPVLVAPGKAVPLRFAEGTWEVVAMIDGTVVGSLPVTALAADLRGPIACQIGFGRIKDVRATSIEGVTFLANDPAAVEVVDGGEAVSGHRLVLRPFVAVGGALEARLGDGSGPMLASCPVDGFDLETDADRIIDVIETYADGSQLVEGHLRMTPRVVGVDVSLSLYTGGTTFADGGLSMSIPSADLRPLPDGSGGASYGIIRTPDAWVCHTIEAFQDGVRVGVH